MVKHILSVAIVSLCAFVSLPCPAQDFSALVPPLRGALLIAQDDERTYLGTFENVYSVKSIFNEYGNFGNPYSQTSIWDEFGRFGGQFSQYSPFNSFTRTPPMIVKNGKVIGYLTTNQFIRGGVNPGILRTIQDQF